MLALASGVVMANCVLCEGSLSTSRRNIVLSLFCMPVMVVYNMKEQGLRTLTLVFLVCNGSLALSTITHFQMYCTYIYINFSVLLRLFKECNVFIAAIMCCESLTLGSSSHISVNSHSCHQMPAVM